MAAPSGPDGAPALAIAIAIGGVVVVMLGGQWLLGLLGATGTFAALPAAVQELLAILLVFGALLGIAWAGLWRGGGVAGLAGPAWAARLGLGLALGVAGLVLAAVQAWLAGGVVRGGGGPGAGLLVGIVAIAVQAGVEEVYFRGWLQPLLIRVAGPLGGVVLAALAFALLHVLGGARAPLALLTLLLGGLWFGLLAQRSGGLALPFGAHFGWNAAEQLGLGLDPNPGVGSFGALVDLDIAGRALWGGTGQGLNASLGTVAVLLALLLPVLPGLVRMPAPRG